MGCPRGLRGARRFLVSGGSPTSSPGAFFRALRFGNPILSPSMRRSRGCSRRSEGAVSIVFLFRSQRFAASWLRQTSIITLWVPGFLVGCIAKNLPRSLRAIILNRQRRKAFCLSTLPRRIRNLRIRLATCPRVANRGPPRRWLIIADRLTAGISIFCSVFSSQCVYRRIWLSFSQTREKTPIFTITASRTSLVVRRRGRIFFHDEP